MVAYFGRGGGAPRLSSEAFVHEPLREQTLPGNTSSAYAAITTDSGHAISRIRLRQDAPEPRVCLPVVVVRTSIADLAISLANHRPDPSH